MVRPDSALLLAALTAVAGATTDKCTGANATCWPDDDAFSALQNTLDGDLYSPTDLDQRGWRAATTLHNKRIAAEPARAVMAASVADVQAVLAFAAANAPPLLVSLKSTGHCYSGNCMAQDSLHLDLSRLDTVEIDEAAQVVRLGPGSNFDALYAAVDAVELLSVGGMCGTVGPVGFSLGGGHGPLVRKFGLGADNIAAVDMVLANGTLLQGVSADGPWTDLFWATQGGGGGSFGVVTSITVRAYPAPTTMTSVVCDWPLAKTTDDGTNATPGVAALAQWLDQVQPEVAAADQDRWHFFTILLKRPIPGEMQVDDWDEQTMDGLLSIEGLLVDDWDGDMAAAIEPLLALQSEDVLNGGCQLTNHSSFLEWHQSRWFGKTPTDMRSAMATSFLQANAPAGTGAELAGTLSSRVFAMPSSEMMETFFGIQLGGKVAQVDSTATAVSAAFRAASMLQETDADWMLAAGDDEHMSWATGTGASVANMSGMAGSYCNEPDPTMAPGVYEEAFWGTNYDQLQAVKQRYDPTAFFECWQCVQGAGV